MVRLLESILGGLRDFRRGLVDGLVAFINGIVELLEALYEWLVEAVKAIFGYIIRFFAALANLIWIFIQLILFYIPAAGMAYYYFLGEAHLGWLIGAIVWAIIITLAGFFYRHD